jgi:hypothetical protein
MFSGDTPFSGDVPEYRLLKYPSWEKTLNAVGLE